MTPMLLDIPGSALNYSMFALVVGLGLWVLSNAGGLEKVWGWVMAGPRARREEVDKKLAALQEGMGQFVDADALDKRFGVLEERQSKIGIEVANQHNSIMEVLRERERLAGGFRGDINQLQKDMHALEPMPARVSNLESKLDNLTTQITEVKTSLREQKQEMREDMRANKQEILQAIQSLKDLR